MLVVVIGESWFFFLALLVSLRASLLQIPQNYIYSMISCDHWSIIVVHGEVLVMIIGDFW